MKWTVKVTEERVNELIRYSTAAGFGTHTSWEIRFAPGAETGETVVSETLRTPFGRVGRGLLAAIGKHPREEVSANLYRMKQLLETGKVTETSASVPGKFA